MGRLTGGQDCGQLASYQVAYKEGPCKRDYEAEIADNQRSIDRDEAFLKALHTYADEGGRIDSNLYSDVVGELVVIIRGRRKNVKFLVEEQERELERAR